MPNEGFCWQKPEDIKYNRTVESTMIGADVAGEVIAALASGSLVFKDNAEYARQLTKGAEKLIEFCSLPGSQYTYASWQNNATYQSSDFHDEEIWWATWMFFATGNYSYLSRANGEELANQAKVFNETLALPVFSFDNKLPGALLLLTRARVIFGFPYPYEEMLRQYHEVTEDIMCSYLHRYNIFNFTKGGLILLRNGDTKPLQYAANAAYISALFAGYLKSQGIPAWTCGSDNIMLENLQAFSASQVDYILGVNPKKLSYVVGYGSRFPTHVHHRGASIPNDGASYGCTEGFKWRDTSIPNPHSITGAMVGGPDNLDRYRDIRARKDSAEPTLTGNAGLVAALAALSVNGGLGVDVDAIFSELKPLTPSPPPPPSPWNPFHG